MWDFRKSVRKDVERYNENKKGKTSWILFQGALRH